MQMTGTETIATELPNFSKASEVRIVFRLSCSCSHSCYS